MEADRAAPVYRVSHVVDGESVELLRRNHSQHYDFATRLRVLTAIAAARRFDWSFFERGRPSGLKIPFD
jgi:hypothetical protein